MSTDLTSAEAWSFEELASVEDATELAVYKKLPLAPVRGEGCYLVDLSGERYLDLYGGHAVALTGHCHPRVVEALRRQAGELLFYSNAVRSPVRAEASRRLLALAPREGSRVFYVSSGAEANEAALKLARKATGRRVVVSFEGGFHGRTLGALSACGIESYRQTAAPVPLLPDHRIVPFGDVDAAAAAIDRETAAVLLEPIQSVAGVRTAPDAFFQSLRERTAAVGASLIFDEVQTAIGRTGAPFFGAHVGVEPDLITLAKGIASGVPCGAVLCSPELAATAAFNDHGATFGGGHLAMAALAATLAVVEAEGLCERAGRMGARFAERLASLPGVVEVRGRGLLLGVELDRPSAPVQRALLERRVLVGGSGHPATLRLLPPLTVGEPELDRLIEALTAALAA